MKTIRNIQTGEEFEGPDETPTPPGYEDVGQGLARVGAAYKTYVGDPIRRGATKVAQVVNQTVNPMEMVADPRGETWGVRGPTAGEQLAGEAIASPVKDIKNLAMTTGAMAAGPVAGAAGLAPGTLASPLYRILGTTLGGAAGAPLQGESATTGAAEGAAGAATGELLAAGGSKLIRSLPWMKGVIAGKDAARMGKAVGEINPTLAGARTAEDLRGLAAGGAQGKLSAMKAGAIQQIEDRLSQGVGGVGPGVIDLPSVQQSGLTIRGANKVLTDIGEGAFNQHILDRSAKKAADRALYGAVSEDIKRGLETADPSGVSRKVWEGAQETYKTGIAMFRAGKQSPGPLGRTGSFASYPERMDLDMPALQRWLRNPRNAAALEAKLGPEKFARFADTVQRGAPIGRADAPVPGSGSPIQAVGEMLRGKGGATQVLALLPRTALPNLGARYAAGPGRQPFALPRSLQPILDALLAEQMGPIISAGKGGP